MKSWFTIVGVMLGILVCPLVRAGETIAVGGALVTVAEGWKKTVNKDETVVLTPADLQAGVACTLTLLGGEAFDGVVKDRLTAEWQGFEELGAVTNDDGGKIGGEGGALQTATRSGIVDLKASPGVTLRVWLLMARANGRLERMVFVTSTPEAFDKYGPAAAAMFNGIKYVAPKAAPEALAGVCFGLVQVKTSTEPECWIFFPDGVVYSGFPYGGPAHMDVDLLRKSNARSFGEYRAEGDDVVVTFKGSKQPTRFARSKADWTAKVTRPFSDRRSGIHGNTIASWTDDVETELRLARAEPCDGMRLAGTYRFYVPFWDEKRPIPTIRFTADGEFVEDGAIRRCDAGAPQAGGGRKASVVPEAGGRGKYSVQQNTLDLTYADGTTIGLTFLSTNPELLKGAPATVYLQEKLLTLVP
jgi:hypothetical protein